MSENGTIHISMMKNWVSHILILRKRGFIVYLAALKKGAIRAAHPYYVIYRLLPPPPPLLSLSQRKRTKMDEVNVLETGNSTHTSFISNKIEMVGQIYPTELKLNEVNFFVY